jgi:hypothetical protein
VVVWRIFGESFPLGGSHPINNGALQFGGGADFKGPNIASCHQGSRCVISGRVEFAQTLTKQAWGGTDFQARVPDGNVISFVTYG